MYGRNDTDGWVTVAQRLQDTTYIQTDLQVGVSYYFVVRAENTHGMSAPSAISEPVIVGIVSTQRYSITSSLQIDGRHRTPHEPNTHIGQV